MLPEFQYKKSTAIICSNCSFVNNAEHLYCTNCGFPLQDKLMVKDFYKKQQEQNAAFFKAENDVYVARIVLYVMASCLLLGVLFLFSKLESRYLVAVIASILSGLFFFLATWSRYHAFPAMFTAFLVLITFFAISIFSRLATMLITSQGVINTLLCVALLFVILKGLQGAYRISIIKQSRVL